MSNVPNTTSSGLGLFSVGLIITAMLGAFKFFGLFPELTLFQILLPAMIGVAIPLAILVMGVCFMIIVAILAAIASALG